MKRLLLCLPALLLTATAYAQVPATPPAGTNVELDPIRCWWRTGAGAVRVGQIFDLSLTCAVLENDAVQVIPDESRLGAAAIALSPFEVIGGSHPADLRSDGRRFFQYHYQLRIISPDAIGRDTPLPSIQIHYAINNRTTNNAAVQGRDLVYILPTEFVRVASMVPANAPDIRDATGEDFANVEAFQFRASALELAATTAVALGALLLVLVLFNLARKTRKRGPVGDRQLPTRDLVGAAIRELGAIGRDREGNGWTGDLVARALAATRVAAAASVGATVSQRVIKDDIKAGDGLLVVGGGFRGKARAFSGSTTPFHLDRAIRTATGAQASRVPLLESLRDAMAKFASAQYTREASLDQGILDEALASARSAAGQVRAEHSWLKTTWRQWRTGSETPVTTGA